MGILLFLKLKSSLIEELISVFEMHPWQQRWEAILEWPIVCLSTHYVFEVSTHLQVKSLIGLSSTLVGEVIMGIPIPD